MCFICDALDKQQKRAVINLLPPTKKGIKVKRTGRVSASSAAAAAAVRLRRRQLVTVNVRFRPAPSAGRKSPPTDGRKAQSERTLGGGADGLCGCEWRHKTAEKSGKLGEGESFVAKNGKTPK
ncbi:hypothetical protein niasHT_036625 [Heterodera trifolii]|uniref:Uncharacterized protein n=1 Tax=Heterodera trifolii TaxID=157864 RepID=A0ABD2IAV7_9BILA